MRPIIQIQLKATVNLGPAKEGYFHFPLKQRNYELLRVPTSCPRLLVVLDLPKNSDEWLTITADELMMRRRAYWLSLRLRLTRCRINEQQIHDNCQNPDNERI